MYIKITGTVCIQIEWGCLLGCFFWYSQIAHIIKTRIICTRKMLLGTVHYLWAGGRRFWGVYYDSGLDNEFDEGLDEESLWEWFIDFRGLSLFIGMGGYSFFTRTWKKSQPPYRIGKESASPLSDPEKNHDPPYLRLIRNLLTRVFSWKSPTLSTLFDLFDTYNIQYWQFT